MLTNCAWSVSCPVRMNQSFFCPPHTTRQTCLLRHRSRKSSCLQGTAMTSYFYVQAQSAKADKSKDTTARRLDGHRKRLAERIASKEPGTARIKKCSFACTRITVTTICSPYSMESHGKVCGVSEPKIVSFGCGCYEQWIATASYI